MEYEVTVVTLDNGKNYIIAKDIIIDGKRYCYFINEHDDTDVCIRRIDKINNEDTFVYLEDEEELQNVLKYVLNENM